MDYLQDGLYVLGETFVCLSGYTILKRTDSHCYFSLSDSFLQPVFPACSILAAPSHITRSQPSLVSAPSPVKTSLLTALTPGL